MFAWTAIAALPLVAAESSDSAAEAPKENAELEAEISYVEALVNYGYPDFAPPVIEATKKKWPESEVRFFAIEIRGMLSLGQFEEAEKKIASLPDRNSTKFWAARLEVANNYYARGQKAECKSIYEGFFKAYPKPPASLRKFYLEACYSYGQLLAGDKQYAKAAERYEALLTLVEKGSDSWCNVGCETVDIYLRLAAQLASEKKPNTAQLKAAEKIVDQLLWQLEKPVYFGRAVSMKAHIEQMKGDLERADAIIDEYRSQLEDIHEQIAAADPDGKLGLLKQSPLPECLYLQAKMLWDEAQAEYKKPKRDDEKVKSYLFGPRDKATKKRQVSKGAFGMAQTVFINYEVSSWAPQAGEMAQAIGDFAKQKYKAKIKMNITPEQIAKARARVFQEAYEKFMNGQLEEAIDSYCQALAKYPEIQESVAAVENVASAYLDLYADAKNAKKDAKAAEYRMNADAVEGYLSERFAGNPNRVLMASAGDSTLRLAAKEQERREPARADRLYTAFVTNYRRHPNAATIAAGRAADLQKRERYDDAIKFWGLIGQYYTNTPHYVTSLSQISACYGKTGDRAKEVEALEKYVALETVKIRGLQAQFKLAQLFQKNGMDDFAQAAEKTEPAEVEALEKAGTVKIIRAIKNFQKFKAAADAALADPLTSKDDAAKYKDLREKAIFMVGACWARMTRPAKNLEKYRRNAAAGYEEYVKEYPEGQFAKGIYVNLGTIYTALGDMAKSKSALDRLSEKYPDSDEAKNAKPRLAKNLIEMGMKKEGAEIYAEMLRTEGGKYSAAQ